jgi:hypothetical protein
MRQESTSKPRGRDVKRDCVPFGAAEIILIIHITKKYLVSEKVKI